MLTTDDVRNLQTAVRRIRVDQAVAQYLLRLVEEIRKDARLRLGLSPRASLTLYRTAQARALTEGRDYTLPEDIRALAVPVLAHIFSSTRKPSTAVCFPRKLLSRLWRVCLCLGNANPLTPAGWGDNKESDSFNPPHWTGDGG